MVNPQEDSLKRVTQAREEFSHSIEYGGQNKLRLIFQDSLEWGFIAKWPGAWLEIILHGDKGLCRP